MADRAQYLTVCEVEVLQEKIDIPMRADPITQHASRPGMDNFPRDKITVEMWIKTRGQGDGIVSYATPEEPNMFLISNQEAIVVTVNGYRIESGVKINDGKWHHLAVSWESETGTVDVFADGESSAPAGIMREVYMGVYGPKTSDLKMAGAYPSRPHRMNVATTGGLGGSISGDFENDFPPRSYGSRFRTIFVPSQTGGHKFSIWSDEGSELWINTKGDRAVGAKKVCSMGDRVAKYYDHDTFENWNDDWSGRNWVNPWIVSNTAYAGRRSLYMWRGWDATSKEDTVKAASLMDGIPMISPSCVWHTECPRTIASICLFM
jgi:hypothetical protein